MITIIIIHRIHFSIQDVNKLKNSVQLSHSVLSKSLQPHGLQHTRLLCLSLFLGVWSNSEWPSSTSSISITWEPARQADSSGVCSRSAELHTLDWSPAICFDKPSRGILRQVQVWVFVVIPNTWNSKAAFLSLILRIDPLPSTVPTIPPTSSSLGCVLFVLQYRCNLPW